MAPFLFALVDRGAHQSALEACLSQLVVSLSEEDKRTVSRARKVQRFLSQSFHVAEQFTGMPGQYVPLKETLRGFKMILNGECDELPESAFLFAGTIDDVFAKAKKG